MSNEKNFNLLASRVSECKKNSLGCVLSLDENRHGRLIRGNDMPIIRFYMKGRIKDQSFTYLCNYDGEITKSIGKTFEEAKKDVIFLAAYIGTHEEASISFKINEEYYDVFPGSDDYLVLYFDAINANPQNKEDGIRSLLLLVDGKSDDRIVHSTSTTTSGMAQMLYALATSFERLTI